jgi:molecular chaperone DnaK
MLYNLSVLEDTVPDLSAIGIDLGTTYSSVAIVNEIGSPELVPNAESERLTPSAVFFDEDVIIVGQDAKSALANYPDQVVMFVKRQMGNPNWHYTHEGQKYSPADISAIILTKLKNDAEAYLGRSLPYVVITVPAYFDDDHRRATINAGEQAGFKVLDVLNEPTAAAISFGIDRSASEETVLVYDLGGGTFDVTVMRVKGKEIKILATDGDHQLGGKDFDDLIMRYASQVFIAEHDFDPTTDASVAGELRALAEKTKRELSKRSKSLLVVRGKGKESRVEVHREKFNDLIKPKLDTTLSLIRSTLKDAKLEPSDVDRILLIGGSTRVPAVYNLLENFFGKEPDASVNPDEAVALGAALIAAQKAMEITPDGVPELVAEKLGGLQITDVTSHSIGIEANIPGSNQRINSILIKRNSPIPAEISKEFVTTMQGQTGIKVNIFQGEFSDPNLCNPVGEFILTGLPPNRPPGCKVRITVSCNTSGVINVTALDIESGQKTTTEVSYKNEVTRKRGAKARWKSDKPIV